MKVSQPGPTLVFIDGLVDHTRILCCRVIGVHPQPWMPWDAMRFFD